MWVKARPSSIASSADRDQVHAGAPGDMAPSRNRRRTTASPGDVGAVPRAPQESLEFDELENYTELWANFCSFRLRKPSR